jgi:hypothetical protein
MKKSTLLVYIGLICTTLTASTQTTPRLKPANDSQSKSRSLEWPKGLNTIILPASLNLVSRKPNLPGGGSFAGCGKGEVCCAVGTDYNSVACMSKHDCDVHAGGPVSLDRCK